MQQTGRVRVAVVGASGYTGGELLRLLLSHPHVSISAATSEQSDGKHVEMLFPNLRGRSELVFEAFRAETVAQRSDFVFLALPHGQAMEAAAACRALGKRVVDLSADFRLRDASVYQQWYHRPHSRPELLREAVYGLPELHREAIRKADLVANPGCYPTGALLGLAPLLQADLILPETIVIDAKSGVSGAGRRPDAMYHFPEANEALAAYGAASHRHRPEIEQELARLTGTGARITFMPHLLPVTRGIYTTIYARMRGGASNESLLAVYRARYANEPFIRLLAAGETPNLNGIRGANDCHLGLNYDPTTGMATIWTTIDNLVKGAAGQAIQNMNLMLGFPETAGLTSAALFP